MNSLLVKISLNKQAAAEEADSGCLLRTTVGVQVVHYLDCALR
jgi:hypothetical protein